MSNGAKYVKALLVILFISSMSLTFFVPRVEAGGWETSGAPQRPQPPYLPDGPLNYTCKIALKFSSKQKVTTYSLVKSLTRSDFGDGVFTMTTTTQDGWQPSGIIPKFVGGQLIRMTFIESEDGPAIRLQATVVGRGDVFANAQSITSLKNKRAHVEAKLASRGKEGLALSVSCLSTD